MATTAYERFLKDQGKDEAVEVDIKEQKPFDLDEVKFNQSSIGVSTRKALETAVAKIVKRMIRKKIFDH